MALEGDLRRGRGQSRYRELSTRPQVFFFSSGPSNKKSWVFYLFLDFFFGVCVYFRLKLCRRVLLAGVGMKCCCVGDSKGKYKIK